MNESEAKSPFEGSWEIGWTRDEFLKVRGDYRLPALLTIARVWNVVRFLQTIIAFPPSNLRPSAARRHELNVYFFMNATLVEVEHAIDDAGTVFNDLAEYRQLLEALRSPALRQLIKRSRTLRKWSAFHYDRKAALEALGRGYFAAPPDFVPFFSGDGRLDYAIYCELADMVPWELAFEGIDESTRGEWVRGASAATTALFEPLSRFLVAAVRKAGARERGAPPRDGSQA